MAPTCRTKPLAYRPAAVVAANDVELATLFKALAESQLWDATKFAIEFALLTGARPSEVRLATWKEFDLKQGVWTLTSDRVKVDRPFRVHLSPQALALLEQAAARTLRTMMSRLGILPHVAELCVNHQETETMRRVYDGHDYFPEMIDAWSPRLGRHRRAAANSGRLITGQGYRSSLSECAPRLPERIRPVWSCDYSGALIARRGRAAA
jgi:integrase